MILLQQHSEIKRLIINLCTIFGIHEENTNDDYMVFADNEYYKCEKCCITINNVIAHIHDKHMESMICFRLLYILLDENCEQDY